MMTIIFWFILCNNLFFIECFEQIVRNLVQEKVLIEHLLNRYMVVRWTWLFLMPHLRVMLGKLLYIENYTTAILLTLGRSILHLIVKDPFCVNIVA